MGGRRGKLRLIGVGYVRSADTVILTVLRDANTAERLSRKEENAFIWEATQKDVVGAGDGGAAQVAGERGVVKACLEVIVMMGHG